MVLDASALLACLLSEPGQDKVLQAILASVRMTTVSFSEVAARFVSRGATRTQVRALRERLPFPLVPVDEDMAIDAGLIIAMTRSAGLSLGDRCRLAAARLTGTSVMTAGRAWLSVADAVGVDVILIR